MMISMEKLKQNFALWIGLGIPVLMIIVIAGIIYIPRWFNTTPPPQYDFLYIVGEEGAIVFGYDRYAPYPAYPVKGVWPRYIYRVSEGKIIREESGPQPAGAPVLPVVDIVPKFYFHRVAINSSTPISFDDAAKYTLDTAAKSLDGWEIVRGQCGGGFFPFYERSCDGNAHYLKKGAAATKLELNVAKDDYREPMFLWIIE